MEGSLLLQNVHRRDGAVVSMLVSQGYLSVSVISLPKPCVWNKTSRHLLTRLPTGLSQVEGGLHVNHQFPG